MSKEFRRQKEDRDEIDETHTGKHGKDSVQDKQSDDVNRQKRESKRLSRERENKVNDNE